MLYYEAKQFLDHEITQDAGIITVAGGQLFTEVELEYLGLSRRWFRKVEAKSYDTYMLYGRRFVDDRDRNIIEEDLT